MALTAGACGDNGGDDDDDMTPDANVDAPVADAAPPDADDTDAAVTDLRAGTIALTDVRVTNDLSAIPGLANGLEGAAVSITYQDLTTATVAPAFGNPSLGFGECHVFVYDVGTNGPPDRVDEGAVTVQNSIHGAFQCTFIGDSYTCVSATDTATLSATVGPAPGSVFVTVTGADFTTQNPFGMYVSIDGFANDVNNGVFPVVGYNAVAAEDTFVIGNPAFQAADAEIGVADVTYTLLPGAGPIPQQDPPYDFLDDGSTDLTVGKTDGDIVPAFSADVAASGQGLDLVDSSPQPHEFPQAAGDWTLTCDDGTDDLCGPDGAVAVGFALSGSTTDADLATSCPGGPDGDACGLPFEMPAPTTQWASFTCRGDVGAGDITLPQAAVEAILGTSPTRIETRLLRVTADLTSDTSGVTSVVVGHGLVGYTNITP